MANKIILKKSSVVSKEPLSTDLDYGELALNYADERIYFKNSNNVIKSFSTTGVSLENLTIGTGLTGTVYNGTTAVTIAIDSTVATLAGTQTLTNKTISGASNTLSNIGNSSLTNSSLTVGTTSISLGGTATSITGLSSVTSTSFVGALTGNASTATTLATGRTIAITGDITYTSPTFNGSANVTAAATLANSGVTAGSYGGSTAIPVLTIDAKGRVTAASTSAITVGDGTLTLATSGIATGSQTFTANQATAATFTVNVPGTNIAEGTRTTTSVPITSSTGTNATLSAATTSLAGVMTSADKTKLDGIATGAEVNQNTFSNVAVLGQTTVAADSKTDTLTLVAGTNVTITTDAVNDSITISANDTSVDWSEIQNKPDPVVTVTLTGDVTGTGNTTLTDLASGTVSFATTISANSVALGTDTTGNYVAGATAGTGISVTGTADEGWSPTITNTAPNVTTDISISHAASTVTVNSSDGADGTINAATTLLAGAMTSADKIKLDGIEAGAQVNVATNLGITAGTTAGPIVTSSTGTNATLPTASATESGVVTTGTQTWAGVKTFSSTITGSISGNAGTATTLATGRTIALTGDVTYTSGSFNGSANVTGTATLASVGTAGTYTKVTTDVKGRVTSGTTLAASDIPNLDAAKITSGIIDAARLPSYVDDVLEFANLAGFPVTGEAGKLYVALDTNKVYRWSGSTYIFITSGAVDSVAGKTGVVTLVKADVGLGSVDNTADSAKNVLSATKLTTARTISLTGDVTGSVSFDGSGNASITTTIAADSVALGTDTTGNYVTSITNGSYITGGNGGSEGAALTLAVDATSANTVSKVVARDASGNFSAGTITASLNGTSTGVVTTVAGTATAELVRGNMADNDQFRILVGGTASNAGYVEIATADDGTEPIYVRQYTGTFTTLARTATLLDGSGNTSFPGTVTAPTFSGALTGNATTATTLQTARTIALTGDVTYTSGAFNGSANVTGTATLANSGVTAGSYGGATAIPVLTIDSKGRVTAASTSSISVGNGTLTLNTSGIATGSQTFTANQSTAATFTVNVPGTNIAEGTRTTTAVPITSSTGTGATLSAASTTLAGVMTSADKVKLDGIAAGAQVNTVTSVASKTGAVTLVKGDVGLGSVDNTADSAKNVLSATKLTTARTIGGVSFDGTAAINLPGVNAVGNQNTTGNAATATLAANSTLAGGLAIATGVNNSANQIVRTDASGYIQAGWINTISGDNNTTVPTRIYASNDGYIRYYTVANFRQVIDVPTRTGGNASGTWGINVTGSAATLTTTRAINGVNFNGSAAITVPGNFTDRTTNESGHISFIGTTATGNQTQYTNTNIRVNPATATVTSETGAFAAPFLLNKAAISTSYSIPSGYNAVAAGPIVINSGITVTVPTGSTWVIV